jgi:hypothetical protein
MSSVTKFTEEMQAMLPQWMKMAKDPDSVGAQFLDSFGLEYQEVETYLAACLNDQYVGSLNIGDIDICYKVPVTLPKVLDTDNFVTSVFLVSGDKQYHAIQVNTLREFYESDDTVCIIDRQEGYVYIHADDDILTSNIMHPFDYVVIDGTTQYEYYLHQIWNVFDEFGLLLGLRRLPAERNADFKNRILDVFTNPGGATKKGLQNGIKRELGIIDGEYEVGSLANPTYFNGLMNSDGTPSKRLSDYVDKINQSLGFAWGTMNWGEAYWRSIEESQVGFYYLPHIWDGYSPVWKDHEVQSGIGDGNDLMVVAPQNEPSVRKFKTYVGLRATKPSTEDLYPEIHFKYKITAKGKIPNQEYKPEDYKYTVLASEIIKLSYIITALKEFSYETKIDWIKNTYIFENATTPGMKITSGEDVLHYPTDPYVKVLAEMATTVNTASPQLKSISLDWTATDNSTHTYTLTSANNFTQAEVVDNNFEDTFATSTGEIELGFGEFYAVVDTAGAFMQGTPTKTIKYNKDGSITLNI